MWRQRIRAARAVVVCVLWHCGLRMPAGQWPGSAAGFHCRVHTVSGEHLCSEEGPSLQTPHTVTCRRITSSAARPSVPAPHVGVAGPGGPGEPVLLV